MSYSISFFLRKNKKDQNDQTPIYCRISTSTKDKAEYFTKIKINEVLWLASPKPAPNGNINYIKGSTEKIKNYNKTLNLITSKVQKKYNDLIEEGAIITASELKEVLTSIHKQDKYTIIYFLEKIVENRQTKRSKITVINYLNRFKEFICDEYKVDDIPVKALLQRKYLGLGAKLADWGKKRKWSKIYIKAMLSVIKGAVNIAVDGHHLEYNPIRYKVKIKKNDVKKRQVLSFQEVEWVENLILKYKGQERARDIFLFQVYTGLSYTDVLNLRRKHISKKANGQYWILKRREKTDVMAKIPLISKAVAILDKYSYLGERCLPVVDNSVYNKSIRKAIAKTDINKHITSHCARHTFATLMRESGSDLSNIKQIVAHSNTAMTEHYAQLTPKTISEEVNKLEKKMGS